MTGKVILLSIEDRALHEQAKTLLRHCGDDVIEASDARDLIDGFQKRRPDVLILEAPRASDWDAMAVARQLRDQDRRLPIILVTTRGSEHLAAAALKIGCKDYFSQPFSTTDLISSVRRCAAGRRPQATCAQDCPKCASSGDSKFPMVENSFMSKIEAYLLKVAAVDSHVLITGETGTGKEVTAQFIHQQSARYHKPLITINCAAIPDTLLESELFGYERGAFTGACAPYAGKLKLGNGGTVFFDEIGEMSPYAQAKLLRVIESREVFPLGGKKGIPLDIRIVAATNRDLECLVATNGFRKDLFYRLNVARIHLPPLRQRKEDIPLLIDHYLSELTARFGPQVKEFTPEALGLLLRHDWPGNIRELKNLLEVLFIDAPHDRIAAADLPLYASRQSQVGDGVTPAERELLLSALVSTNWNKSKAAEQLHWSRMTLYRKMTKYHIQESQAGKPEAEISQK